ncbi:hypothetical protein PX699_00220 [Sphingobium sp. H39-3-25]|uniref:hypothetical protein n=1 Tax=Sphingobium arseniciresistens TaxID=3030834 RepID=UPI0023B8E564|nr:hypothetical protein [Sphingobium arseniciresistens]
MRRVLMLLDVTDAEALVIADAISAMGPTGAGMTVKDGLEVALAAQPGAERYHVAMRSDGSAALGGPPTPEFDFGNAPAD